MDSNPPQPAGLRHSSLSLTFSSFPVHRFGYINWGFRCRLVVMVFSASILEFLISCGLYFWVSEFDGLLMVTWVPERDFGVLIAYPFVFGR